MENISEQISFEQAQSIISCGDVPDINRFSFSLDYSKVRSKKNLGADGVSRTQKEYETNYEETLISHAILSENFNASKVLINAELNAIPYVKRERFRIRTFKEDTYGPHIEDSDCNEWSEWSPWTETRESILELAERVGAPEQILSAIRERLKFLSSEESLAEDLKKVSIDPYKDKIVRAKQTKDGRQVSLYGFQDAIRAKEIEYKWQQQVTQKFFRVGKTLSKDRHSHDIWNIINTHLESGQTSPIPIDGFTGRSFIIAMSKILSTHRHMPELIFKIGSTKIKLTRATSHTERQQGNFSMQLIPKEEYPIAYGQGLIKRLSYFTSARWDSAENAQNRNAVFLNHIESKLITMTPFTYLDLNKFKKIRINSEEAAEPTDPQLQSNLDFLNSLLFLVTTVEVLVRLYRTEQGAIHPYTDLKAIKSDAFPVAIAQARSLTLLLEGKMTFNDFFGATEKNGYDSEQHRAYYGAVTGKSTIEYVHIMLEKLGAINVLNNDMIINLSNWRNFVASFKRSNPAGHIIEGKSRMYFDLKSGYGSGNESDPDSNYSDMDDSELGEIVPFHL